MTASEALKIVTECGLNIEESAHEESMVQIKSALEKQIPKKPTDIVEWKTVKLTVGSCPICGTGVNKFMKHCDDCGQMLDWSEEND